MQHKRKTVVTLLLLAMVSGMSILARDKDAPEYKNLQILPKDISEPNLKKIMDGFCASMNVKCGFCHVRNNETKEFDYASDAKGHKKDAREMMLMTNEMNAKYFKVDLQVAEPELVITCYTCHRGKEHPMSVPPPNTDSVKVAQ